MHDIIDSIVSPDGCLDVLSRAEVNQLLDTSRNGAYRLFRNCALAVLNTGSRLDDGKELLERYQSFSIRILHEESGVKLELNGAPTSAFVDGRIIQGIKEHLFAVLRDVVYVNGEIHNNPKFDLDSSEGITDAVFQILRNADSLCPSRPPHIVVCWGGHAISRKEYDYAKEVGYQMGLRGLDICTGCGPGAMKGPMKGANVGHAKQRIRDGRYFGITEPGIIAAEPPNPIVNDLVILPDIEKRLEAFVRTGHAVVVFPGGVGTAEEILYLIGILLDPNNADMPFPLIFTGAQGDREYFRQIDAFIGNTLGEAARKRYRIIIDDPVKVAREVMAGTQEVRSFRKKTGDAYFFNWMLKIDHAFQQVFIPTHENMGGLQLHSAQAPHRLAANLRRAFSGIVAGNVKEGGIRTIEQHGPFELRGDADIIDSLKTLLDFFTAQHRMKLSEAEYTPSYRLIK